MIQRYYFSILTLAAFLVAMPLHCRAQHSDTVLGRAFDDQPNLYLYKWDSLQGRLILYRSRWSQPTVAVRMVSVDGRTILSVAPLAELTDDNYVSIADAAATPDGGVVLAATLKDSSSQSLTDVILTYDNQGHLSQLWQVAPYSYRAIAVGNDGSVYAFGDRIDVDTTGQDDSNVSLLIHYSKDGKVLGEQLPLKLFEKGLEVVNTDRRTGEHHMLFSSGKLVFYLATSKEVFIFDPQLRLEKRVALAQSLSEMKEQSGYSEAQIREISFDGSSIYAQTLFWSVAPRKLSSKLVAIDPNNSAWRFFGNDLFDKHPGFMLQATADGDVLALQPDKNSILRLDWYKP
jgi:hypothetical protein